MNWLYLLIVITACGGCGGGGAMSAPATPPPVLPTYYYVGSTELNLKDQPDAAGKDTALVRLNEPVQMIQRRGAWFLVKAADGRQGWANEKSLTVSPLTDLYVRRWGVRLRTAPTDQAKTVARLRTNDAVKFQEQNNQGWARVTVPRTGSSGWLEMSNLSTERVVVRRRVRRASQPAASEPGSESPAAPAQESPSLLAPAPAQAAPSPPKPEAPAPRRKTSPGLFEPF
jgi:uncharacterized protein YgiM (DUF1202 family)